MIRRCRGGGGGSHSQSFLACCRGRHQPKLWLIEPEPANDFFSSCDFSSLTTASQLEQFLTRRLAVQCPSPPDGEDNDEEQQDDNDTDADVVFFATRYDAHWLKCDPIRAGPLMTILGIYEDEGNPDLPVQISSYVVRATDLEGDELQQNERDCGCRPLHSEWKRQRTIGSTSVSAFSREEVSSTYQLQWIDFRSIQDLDFLSTPEGVWHFLTSLLGSSHDRNPWVAMDDEPTTNNKTTDGECVSTPEMIVLLMPRFSLTLRDFRVSDACPAWFFHGYAYLEDCDLEGGGTAVMYMYKRLKRRIRLTPEHPSLPSGETCTTMTIPIGCLWEIVPPKDEDKDDEDETKLSGNIPSYKAGPTYRPVSPPYLNLEQEYGRPVAQGLLSSQAIEVFRQEALQIPQWTPWPETQHYSVGRNGETTWSVFPLCYCFPSKDVSKRTWVEQTRHFCPQTCRLLESVLGDTLRTALFSQLKPQTVLEAHTGWADLANDVLRLHIPLVLPSSPNGGLCGTWVDGCVETHQEGRPLLFDDSKIHRAFNYHPTGSRIVLIVDLARPSTLPPGTATGGHSDELDQFIAQMSTPK